VASPENFPLLDELLAEQQRLDTPVARFSSAHDRLAAGSHAIAPQLIPLSAPKPGEQYAFEVDLDSCTGCKSCVAACHSLNGLDETETWRDVGLLVGGHARAPFTQTITTACHHCADPACLNGCPVLAYEKDPVTGIVRHLDDQCIGCSYCILKCPYDVPKFSARLGIVRKCDMCHSRLAEGEAPACAQACPTQAIRIVTVSNRKPETENRKASDPADSGLRSPVSGFLPSAPDPAYTQPTTRYLARRAFPENVAAADAAALRPQPPHWPLVVLLLLMPMAVGCGVTDKLLSLSTPALAVLCWLAGATGLVFSVAHLGQPRRAWRVFLGLRKSWLSREALVFGAWFLLATLYTLARLGWLPPAIQRLHAPLAIATATLGLAGLFCSVMIYVDTRRAFWRFAHTAPRFFGSASILGIASALAAPGAPRWLGFALAAATGAKLLFEARALDPLNGDRDTITPARQTALLLAGPLRPANELRVAAGVLGGVLAPLMLALGLAPAFLAWPALALCLGGELAERYLFFRAVDAPKMPGQPA
ncbi:MAG TPA: DmsC/YnfH family molybdoenzyme membrane anchor subunit, partial [Opitutaceae bacterium]|nr:DmsC/YnfH family molybdoenzyme membrane anchor subunit [Opitutaceae bacterium]